MPTALEILQARQNFTVQDTSEEHFFRCWRHQDCKVCLAENQCSWCPMTSACVPNPYTIPLLAPAWNEDICPHWAERWELRTRPLGCQVSTITSLTSIISIVSTLIVVLLVFLLVIAIRWGRRRSQREPGWWRVWRYDWMQVLWPTRHIAEQDPLLGQDHNIQSRQTE
ncbi:uncharacterized protein CTRU02_205370 [Colletotrichum truncatum]|uniref:Uncharacterized protein n=1 Tax=Colletotrichum truncatum TaxID=5467 RepID=A0ACC3Z446_COLTU